jgi:menaquinone-9 beta-reductase
MRSGVERNSPLLVHQSVSRMTSLPCIIIGGGPAGAACAIELARKGRRAIVLERTRSAHHKVCGEFISAEARSLIAALGVDIRALGATDVKSLSLACAVEVPIVDLPFSAAGLSRWRLDEELLQAATHAGVEVVRGATVTRLDAAADSIAVHASGRQFRAASVVLATGKHDLRGCMRPRGCMTSFKLHLRVSAANAAKLRNLVHLTIFPGGYGGACLVEGGIVAMCWVMEQELLRRIGAAWQAQAIHLSLQSDFFGDLLAHAQALWEKPVAVAAIPYGFVRRRAICQSIYPVGDQLAVIPSYTGDGISIALHSGIAAARAIVNGTPAGEFQHTMTAGLRPQMMWAKASDLLLNTSAGQRLGAVMGKLLPSAMPRLIPFVINATRLRSFDPR